ncbi:MAG: hypothetical protein HOQ05_09325 [Corynebacteriales bacterium]|nr:hypothetical protein [Mycobacteriales bacterium]
MDIPRPLRPLLSGDMGRWEEATDDDPVNRMELAQITARTVVDAGRDNQAGTDLVALADTVGLETLAQLWREQPADSLPGALWALYLLRTWCRQQGDEVARLFRAGRALAPVDEVVAGAPEIAGPVEMAELADAVLTGIYDGDLAVALERAAAFFRIVAAGRDLLATEGEPGALDRQRAARNRSCAVGLTKAAQAWHDGTLQ